MKKEFTCIGCPMGCALLVELDSNNNITVTGHTCKIGEDYGVKEFTNPTRVITTSVKVIGGNYSQVSVKTEKDIPKEKIFDCLKALKGVEVKAPVKIGDVIYSNIENTGVNIIATRNIEEC